MARPSPDDLAAIPLAALMARETLNAFASRSPRITQRKVGLSDLLTFASPPFFAAASAFDSSGSSDALTGRVM